MCQCCCKGAEQETLGDVWRRLPMIGKIGSTTLLLWLWLLLTGVSYELVWLADVRHSVRENQMRNFWLPVRALFFFSLFCLLAAGSLAAVKTILKSKELT